MSMFNNYMKQKLLDLHDGPICIFTLPSFCVLILREVSNLKAYMQIMVI
jgi:hypothetical protein